MSRLEHSPTCSSNGAQNAAADTTLPASLPRTFEQQEHQVLVSEHRRLSSMPGSVPNSAPSVVMPASLCVAFLREQHVPVLGCEHPGGSSQRKALAANSRKRRRLSRRLTPAQLATLRDFYEACNGLHEPFYFYDPYESNPKFFSDPAGASPEARYVVRFHGTFSQEIGMGRANVDMTLIQLAQPATPTIQCS